MEKRTENEILKDFEKLGYRIEKHKTSFVDNCESIILLKDYIEPFDNEKLTKEICINLEYKTYECYESFYYCPQHIPMKEHKLLTELFELWGWL